MGSPEERLRRMNKLFSLIVKCDNAGKPASKKTLIAEFCCQTGTWEGRVKEYLRLFEESGRIEVAGDRIWLKK